MAGVGKTALALHVAHGLAERFPDGQVFLDLRGYTPGAEPLTAAAALSLRDSASQALSTDEEIAARLQHLPGCGGLTRSAVNFDLEYLTDTKFRLRSNSADKPTSRRADLVSLALRFDIVHHDHLQLLDGPRS